MKRYKVEVELYFDEDVPGDADLEDVLFPALKEAFPNFSHMWVEGEKQWIGPTPNSTPLPKG